MRSRAARSLFRAGIAVAVGALVVVAGPVAAQEVDPSSSLSLFPSELSVQAGRGEVVERTIGVVQTGEPSRELRFEVSGDAAGFVTVLDATDRTTPLQSIVVTDTTPAYALVRVAPGLTTDEGPVVARIRLVDVGGTVTVGSELRVAVDVQGTYDFGAALLGAEVVTPAVEVGQQVRVHLDVDVTGSAPLVPEVTATFRGPAGVERPLVARPEGIEGHSRSTLEVSWPTTDWELGLHEGQVVLRSGTAEVGRAPLAVEVVPLGSTVPAVTVLGAELASSAPPDGVAKVVVEARNDGTVEGRVVFVGDVLFGTTPVGPVRSDALLVAPGEVVEMEVYVQLGDPGTYRVRGRANLDGAESSTVSVDIEVSPPAGRPWVLYAAGAAVVVAVGVGLISLRRRRSSGPGRGGSRGPGARPGPRPASKKSKSKKKSSSTTARPGVSSPPGISVKVRR